MADLTKLIKERGAIKASLTRFVTFLKDHADHVPNIKLRLVDVKPLLNSFNTLQIEIEYLIPPENKIDFDNCEKERLDFENKYYAALQKAEKIILESVDESVANLSRTSSPTNSSANSNIKPNVHLPKINLPKYEGRLDEWLYFKETFDSLINNNDSLAEIQKFHYLRSVLKGDAADVIESLEITSRNYKVAWELLNERFSNKKLLILSHVKAIFELPNNNNRESCSHLRAVLDGTTKHLRALKTLKQPVEHWDTLIVYQVSTKLDNKTRRELEKEYCDKLPNIKNLSDFLKEKCTMLENLSANNNSSQGECSKNTEAKIEETASTENVKAESKVTLSSFNGMSQVLLSTAIVRVIGTKTGQVHEARVLLDSGSESHFITQELANKLKLPTSKIELKVTGLNQSATDISKKVDLLVQAHSSAFSINISCLVVPSIGGNIPSAPVDIETLNIPDFVQLADKSFNQAGKIDILIGSERFWQLVRPRQHSLGKNKPMLQETSLGWIVAGVVPTKKIVKGSHCGFVSNQTLDSILTRFWELESCPDKRMLSPEEEFCENNFKSSTTRLPSGRFVVRYPLKHSIDKLGESRQLALKRFKHIEKKLNRDLSLKIEYTKFIEEYERLGHMTKLKNVHDQGAYYMPHHCVIKRDSLTTRVRVVFDASAKTTSGSSLNDIQVTGPVIQQDLFSIIIRFRKHNFVITADITKMYRQILIHEEQRPLQRIFWRNDESQDISCYELNTVTYGTAAASFLAVRCLLELAKENSLTRPVFSSIIENNFYMDDLIAGGETVEQIKEIYHEVTDILKGGCFALNKWSSNDPQVLEEIQCADKQTILNMNEGGESKTLGLSWHAKEDEFKYSIAIKEPITINTKRIVLSVIAQIFDPLGLLGPVIISAKLILQRLWQYNLSWDDPIPIELNREFVKFKKQLPTLNDVKVMRHVFCKYPIRIELHGFADASEMAYGAAIYARSVSADGNIYCRLLCAKSRVAPLKMLTVPRLELCAAFLLANLFLKVEKALEIKFDQRFYWCDSKIVIAWINTAPHLLKMFVANRVSEIQTLTRTSEWCYVNTRDNPADLLTRGVEPKELEKNLLWWHGPQWLSNLYDFWPLANELKLETVIKSSEFKEEERKVKVILMTNLESCGIFDKFSSYKKLQRVWAYCMRFCKNAILTKENRLSGSLTSLELLNSATSLIKIAQQETFKEDLQDLKNKKQVRKTSKTLALNPFLDADSVIRVGGRLKHSSYEFYKKHPAILDSKHPLSKLLVRAEHEKLLHAGPQTVLASLRERIWIVAARNLVRNVIRECVSCFKAKPVSVDYIMADLPKVRVTAARPFINCGIDFAGPFLLKDRKGRKYNTVKAYVCLFVCLSSRAIHLELVSELTTDAFVAALHRFVSRRGHCLNIYSDNGTNFVGAKREIYKLQNAIKDSSLFEELNWHFIPPRAPHFGGIWEAGVKSFKFHFNRIVKDVKLTFEEFVTIITQIEGCLNSRPLYPMSNDPNDPIALTPGHFLIGHPIVGLLEPPLQEAKTSSLKRFQFLQQMKQQFWSRWSREYISEMQVRAKWKVQHPILLKTGVLVLVKEDNLPPLKWELGRVLSLHPGSDGVVRAVTLKTKSGVIKRPTMKVCILPLQET